MKKFGDIEKVEYLKEKVINFAVKDELMK